MDMKHARPGSSSGPSHRTGTKIGALLDRWDKGNKKQRKLVLKSFIREYNGQPEAIIEDQLSHAASLLMARIVTSLRLQYLTPGSPTALHLKAIGIFIGAGASRRYLDEFVASGGVLTLHEIIAARVGMGSNTDVGVGVSDAEESRSVGVADGEDEDVSVSVSESEDDVRHCLLLLQRIAATGKRYKALICQNGGLEAVAECLEQCSQDRTLDTGRSTLAELASLNQEYAGHIHGTILALLQSSSNGAVRSACLLLRDLHSTLTRGSPGDRDFVWAAVDGLRCSDLQVQYECADLLVLLSSHPDLLEDVVEGIIGSLTPTQEDVCGATRRKHRQGQAEAVDGDVNGVVGTEWTGFERASEDEAEVGDDDADYGSAVDDVSQFLHITEARRVPPALRGQAAAAKMVARLVSGDGFSIDFEPSLRSTSAGVSVSIRLLSRLLSGGVVPSLLFCLGSTEYRRSQELGGAALRELSISDESVRAKLKEYMGTDAHNAMVESPVEFAEHVSIDAAAKYRACVLFEEEEARD